MEKSNFSYSEIHSLAFQKKTDIPRVRAYPSKAFCKIAILIYILFSGEFMGTDFNYLYSEDMRKAIDENCLEPNMNPLALDEYHDPYQNNDWAQFLPNNRNIG